MQKLLIRSAKIRLSATFESYQQLSIIISKFEKTADNPETVISNFYQQKIEWVRLKEEHPVAFEEARSYEKIALENQSPFTWSQGESLDDLERPERVAQIKQNFEKRLERLKTKRVVNPLNDDSELTDLDEVYGSAKMCIACHK